MMLKDAVQSLVTWLVPGIYLQPVPQSQDPWAGRSLRGRPGSAEVGTLPNITPKLLGGSGPDAWLPGSQMHPHNFFHSSVSWGKP